LTTRYAEILSRFLVENHVPSESSPAEQEALRGAPR
jgi:hypothetical protein